MQWLDNQTLDFGDLQFELETTPFLPHSTPAQPARNSTRERFILRKSPSMIHNLLDLLKNERVRYIVEIGIYKGGSCALYQRLFRPEKLVAIELSSTPEPALEDYIRHHHLSHAVKLYYGTNQSDYETLTRIVNDEFPGQPLDLVVDDASHLFLETKASFQALFPFLRADGYYIIEDWGWAHWPGELWQNSVGIRSNRPALTNLIVELTMLCASRPDIISNITLDQKSAVIRRGPAHIEPGRFDVGELYLSRGWKWRPLI